LAAASGIDALLITPGSDLRYLSGYVAKPLERLTCLIVPADGDPSLIVPELEVAAAEASRIDVTIRPWGETQDPFAIIAGLLPGARAVAVDDQMWASRVLALRDALPGAEIQLAGPVISRLRMIKDDEEVRQLREAAQAIDRVHARMGEWLRAGRTEREVGADIAAAIIAEGHEAVDFVIVASGPNGASPHHEVSDRVISAGEPVVVDIGGTMPSGYCSDCTRNYVVGPDAPEGYFDAFHILFDAQAAQRSFAGPGVSAAAVDRTGREILAAAGLGEEFIHRTGHGIGLSTHEEPYIVADNEQLLEPGMAFSIEPGFYRKGQFGARIEDIVICTPDGVEVLNHQPRGLVHLPT
jgi:Xaa-Pro aminopeptidase